MARSPRFLMASILVRCAVNQVAAVVDGRCRFGGHRRGLGIGTPVRSPRRAHV